MTEHRDGYADFVFRTWANASVIADGARAGRPDHYEVTQFVNSLLGLTVFAKEAHLDQLPRTVLRGSAFDGLVAVLHGQETCRTLPDLVKLMRHAVAHYNIHLDVAQGEIIGIVMWNCPPGADHETSIARIDAAAFEALTEALFDALMPVAVQAARQDRLADVETRRGRAFRCGD